MDLIKVAEQAFDQEKNFPLFKSGDTVTLVTASKKEIKNVFRNSEAM